MAKHKISISFKRKYHDVYVFLNHLKENNENVSDYICKLVQADMSKEQTKITFSQSEIEKMILEALLKTHQVIPLNPPSQTEKQKTGKLSEEDIDLLNNLF
jgi:predicted CopG family antitoxin